MLRLCTVCTAFGSLHCRHVPASVKSKSDCAQKFGCQCPVYILMLLKLRAGDVDMMCIARVLCQALERMKLRVRMAPILPNWHDTLHAS